MGVLDRLFDLIWQFLRVNVVSLLLLCVSVVGGVCLPVVRRGLRLGILRGWEDLLDGLLDVGLVLGLLLGLLGYLLLFHSPLLFLNHYLLLLNLDTLHENV